MVCVLIAINSDFISCNSASCWSAIGAGIVIVSDVCVQILSKHRALPLPESQGVANELRDKITRVRGQPSQRLS
jgi:hypothetical protein